jgi:cytochrome oxidase Cu insertion factor (SCO1/SenC/PrrC family)
VIRVLGRIAGALAILYVAFLGAVFAVMRQPPTRFGQIMRHFPMPALAIVPFEPMWNSARGGTLRVGDQAPDFTLPRSDKSGEVKLSSLRGKPVVLVFGSYT